MASRARTRSFFFGQFDRAVQRLTTGGFSNFFIDMKLDLL